MKRRDFLSLSVAGIGGAFIAKDALYAQAMKEISAQFSEKTALSGYDLVVHGAGTAGYYTAMAAARKGLKVLILDKRTFPGFDITAKRNLWLQTDGIDAFDSAFADVFLPEGEMPEIANPGAAPRSSRHDGELLLFAGSVKKTMLRNLIVNRTDVLLMTDVCGIIADGNAVSGVLIACKHGMYAVNCKSFVDASDNNFFTRDLFSRPRKITKAGFVVELLNADNPTKRDIKVPEIPVVNNTVRCRKGKLSTDQMFVSFEFVPEGIDPDITKIEQQARTIAADLSRALPGIDATLQKAKLHYQASECTYTVEGELPEPTLGSYYRIAASPDLSCGGIVRTANAAESLVKNIKLSESKHRNRNIKYIGGTLPCRETGQTVDECGFPLPLMPFAFDRNMIAEELSAEVFVAGAGTAGAQAAKGASRKGADTLVAEYFNDLGGTKTVSGVAGEYFGDQDNEYFKRQKAEVGKVAAEYRMSLPQARAFCHLKELSQAGCRVMTDMILCGAVTEKNRLTGVVACRNGKLCLIKSDVTIDATGDADIAFFAGEKYDVGNSRTGRTQNYSQWDIPVKNMPTHNHRDFDLFDHTRISEFQRGLFLTHYMAHFYDFYPLIGVREARRPASVYQLTVVDVLNGARFDDLIAKARSDFDPHYITASEFSRCGFLLPHSNTTACEIPYRAIVPASVDGLLLSARGIGQTHNALQFTRMSADVLVLGYVTGQIAATLAKEKIRPRDFDVSRLQKTWIDEGILSHLPAKAPETVREKVDNLRRGGSDALFACCRLPEKEVLPVLSAEYRKSPSPQIARALAWFGAGEGTDSIITELDELFRKESDTGYPDGYTETYNQDGLYWQINRDIALLAMSGAEKSKETILNILKRTSSGGGIVKRSNDYDNNRIDMLLLPYHQRIINLCFYIERMPDARFIPECERLLRDKNIGGYRTTEYNQTRWRAYQADLELTVAAALARCGGKKGLEVLADYLTDIHSDFRGFAQKELTATLGKDFGYDADRTTEYIRTLKFPIKPAPLKKEIEL